MFYRVLGQCASCTDDLVGSADNLPGAHFGNGFGLVTESAGLPPSPVTFHQRKELIAYRVGFCSPLTFAPLGWWSQKCGFPLVAKLAADWVPEYAHVCRNEVEDSERSGELRGGLSADNLKQRGDGEIRDLGGKEVQPSPYRPLRCL